MPDQSSAIPLADVLRAANELVSGGLMENYALGGALAAVYYTEPVTTYDADIIFVASDKAATHGAGHDRQSGVGRHSASL